jgi:PPM family protein phosphatase
MRVEWGMATHTGRIRKINQDSVIATPPVFVVADGMGGHAAGEVASAIAVEVLGETLGTSPTTVAQLVNAVRTANIEILRQAYDDESMRGMGTTVTGVALVTDEGEEELAIVNVGDSRTYLFRDGELAQITRDHTYVEDLVAAGEITPDDARTHPQRHILTRVLGVEPDVEVDLWIFKPVTGDRYLVCSDGLTNEVPEGRMTEVLHTTSASQAVCNQLLQEALDHGARDNVTVIVVDVVDAEGTMDAPVADAEPVALVPELTPGDVDVPGAPAAAAAAIATAGAVAEATASAEESAALAAALTPTGADDRPSETRALPVTPGPGGPAEPPGGWLDEHAFDVPDAPVPPETRPADITTPVTRGTDAPPAVTIEAAQPPAAPGKPPKPPRDRKRRRRIGVATGVTVLAVLVVLAVAVGGILYYGRTGYYIAFAKDGSVAVFQGRPDGVLWVQPTLEVVYPLHRDELAPEWQSRIERTIALSSLDAADRWYQALASNPNAVPGLAPTTTVAPTTTAPTTTTVAGATTTGAGP